MMQSNKSFAVEIVPFRQPTPCGIAFQFLFHQNLTNQTPFKDSQVERDVFKSYKNKNIIYPKHKHD